MPQLSTTRARVQEATLEEVQRGSLPHFKQLGDRWPSDFDTAERALFTLLDHLGLDLIPHIEPGKPFEKGMVACISRSLASVKVLPVACKYFETVLERDRQTVLEIFESRRSGVFGWLRVLVRNVASLLPDPDNPADLPLATIAVMLKALIELCRKQSDHYNFHESIIDVSIEIWIAGAERQRRQPPLDVHEYYRAVVPILQLFAECVAEGPFDSITINTINQFRGRARNQCLVDAFILHSQQYASAYREHPDTGDSTNGLVCMLAGTRLLSSARRFYRLLVESSFPSIVLTLALDLSLVLSEPGDGSLAIQVASQSLRPQGPTSYEHTHVIPQLLEVGYLNVIAQDLSSPRELGAHPFPNWEAYNPLRQLYIACFHPRVTSAVKAAIDKLPLTLAERIKSNSDPDVRRVWEDFVHGVAIYDKAHIGVLKDHVGLCDNILHYQMQDSTIGQGSGVQCSCCRSVVYCSRQCQREDWRTFHREECPSSRINRIAMQNRRGCISHRQRVQVLRVQETVFRDALQKGDKSSSPYCRKILIGACGGLWVDTTDFPIQWVFLKPEQLVEMSHGGRRIFTDPRALALIEQAVRSEGVRLVGSIGQLGEFAVVTLTTFLVEPAEGSLGDSDDLGPGVRLRPLHVVVRSFEISDEDVIWHAGEIRQRSKFWKDNVPLLSTSD